jgi:hypothetical protein
MWVTRCPEPHLAFHPASPQLLSWDPSLGLTWPWGSSVLLVSLTRWKDTGCRIQWAPVAGESG